MIRNDPRKPMFDVGQRVRVAWKDTVYIVSAVYRVESWYVYEVGGMPQMFIKENFLFDAEPK